MTATAATHRADARTCHRLRNRLTEILRRTPHEIRVTHVRWGDGSRWCVLALTVRTQPPFSLREIPIADGDHHRAIADLLKDAFPDAWWDRAQDYDVADGVLREHITQLPACLREDIP